MKPRWHIGWMLFALAMVWGECIGDIPRLLFPHRTTAAHFLAALLNATAVMGLTFYAFRWNGSRAFWRIYAPVYAAFLAFELGTSIVSLTGVITGLMVLGRDAPLVIMGGIVVLLPITAMAVFTAIALFRLGDWFGPTRRPLGLRGQQLSLPL